MPKYKNLSDDELISFLQEGDRRAYTEIFDRYFELLFVFAYKKLGDEQMAKEVVHELFSKLWEGRAGFGDVSSLSSCLLAALCDSMLRHFKHPQVGQKYVEFLGEYIAKGGAETPSVGGREKKLAEYIAVYKANEKAG